VLIRPCRVSASHAATLRAREPSRKLQTRKGARAGTAGSANCAEILRFCNAPGRTPSSTRAFELSGDLLLQSRCVGLCVELRSIDGARISLPAFCLLGHWQSSRLGLTVQSIASEMQRGWTSLNFEPAVQGLWWPDACGSAALWRFSRAPRWAGRPCRRCDRQQIPREPRGSAIGRSQTGAGPNTSTALRPPNANEFDMA